MMRSILIQNISIRTYIYYLIHILYVKYTDKKAQNHSQYVVRKIILKNNFTKQRAGRSFA